MNQDHPEGFFGGDLMPEAYAAIGRIILEATHLEINIQSAIGDALGIEREEAIIKTHKVNTFKSINVIKNSLDRLGRLNRIKFNDFENDCKIFLKTRNNLAHRPVARKGDLLYFHDSFVCRSHDSPPGAVYSLPYLEAVARHGRVIGSKLRAVMGDPFESRLAHASFPEQTEEELAAWTGK